MHTSSRFLVMLIAFCSLSLSASVESAMGYEWVKESGIRVIHDLSKYQQASPSVVRLGNGSYRMYYSEAPLRGLMYVVSAVSSDGLHWTKEPGIRVGGETAVATYPDVVTLADGSYRMYFHRNRVGGGHQIYSAVSDEGLYWTEEGILLVDYGAIPDVVQLPDGNYRMYFYSQSQEALLSAISPNGLDWTVEAGTRLTVLDGAYTCDVHIEADGRFRMYLGSRGGTDTIGFISSAVSQDGLNWELERDLKIDNGAMPEVLRMPDGLLRMYYIRNNWDIASAVALGTGGPQPAGVAWEFNTEGDAEGWAPIRGLGSVQVSGGFLRAVVTDTNPHLRTGAGSQLDASEYQTLRLGYTLTSSDSQAQFMWGPEGVMPGSGGRWISFDVIADGVSREAVVDLSRNPAWTGIADRFRLDPLHRPEIGDSVAIDYIRIEE
ncbi:MAG: hypothetical protein JW937_01310 [Candidatus Omnitrophica bacterium]|nr:hypothetical protein [Candidatus Omnitrophota bacterium]